MTGRGISLLALTYACVGYILGRTQTALPIWAALSAFAVAFVLAEWVRAIVRRVRQS